MRAWRSIIEQPGKYSIVGKPTPYQHNGLIVELADILISNTQLRVELKRESAETLACECGIWEHTVHELEALAESVRRVSERVCPPSIEVERENSQIGAAIRLPVAITIEVGYSLDSPGTSRARFFCFSRTFGMGNSQLGIVIGLAVSGAYGEVILDPSDALAFAHWIEEHLAQLYIIGNVEDD